MLVRRARPQDARAIAEIHVHAWQAAYRGIVPQAFLDALSVEDRERKWQQILALSPPTTWVADEGDRLRGWISAARSRDSDAAPSTGEIWGLYVDPSCWRRGVGRLLLREAERALAQATLTEVTLWVLQGNVRAAAFYQSCGFAIEAGREKGVVIGGAELLEIRLRKRLDHEAGAA